MGVRSIGWRSQESRQVRISKGSHATEGWGVYIALDRSLAASFNMGPHAYLLKLEFTLNRPLITSEPCYILQEDEILEEPIQAGDSDWLKANKHAYQEATADGTSWGQAQEVIGFFVTEALQRSGYDGVIIDQGHENRWAIVFNVNQVRQVDPTARERYRKSSRETRLIRTLAGQMSIGRQALRPADPRPLGWEDHKLLTLLDQHPQGLSLSQIAQQLGQDISQYVDKLFHWGYLERLPGQRYRTFGASN